MARAATLLALAATALLFLPSAAAHTPVFSADNKVRGSIGLLNEPVSTYAVTGLDVCFSQNTASTPRPAVNVTNAGAFTALLRAPNGATHTADLEVPFGRPNCLTFADPLVLTQPGQYVVDLTGSINGTTFSVTNVAAGGAVLDRASITFPDAGVPTETQLDAKIAALQGRLDALEAAEAAEDQAADSDEGEFAPPSPAALLMLGLAGLVVLLRRRA